MLDKLKEYRDIISLLVFFLGGFFWIEAQFATKAALNAEKCLLSEAIRLGQLQTHQTNLQDDIQSLNGQITDRLAFFSKLSEKPSPSMQDEVDQMKSSRDKDLSDLHQNIKDQQSVIDDMGASKCES